jgi:hypothetical protein
MLMLAMEWLLRVMERKILRACSQITVRDKNGLFFTQFYLSGNAKLLGKDKTPGNNRWELGE